MAAIAPPAPAPAGVGFVATWSRQAYVDNLIRASHARSSAARRALLAYYAVRRAAAAAALARRPRMTSWKRAHLKWLMRAAVQESGRRRSRFETLFRSHVVLRRAAGVPEGVHWPWMVGAFERALAHALNHDGTCSTIWLSWM